MSRQRRDPADKAQEALDIAERRVAKLHAKYGTLAAEMRAVQAELEVAEADVAYLAQNPRLAAAERTEGAS